MVDPEDRGPVFDELLAHHGVGPKAVRQLRQARVD